MDVRNIFILFNKDEFTKEEIVADLKEEGYKHNFIFGFKLSQENLGDYLRKCDEVWCFGECADQVEFQVSKEMGKDVWIMG